MQVIGHARATFHVRRIVPPKGRTAPVPRKVQYRSLCGDISNRPTISCFSRARGILAKEQRRLVPPIAGRRGSLPRFIAFELVGERRDRQQELVARGFQGTAGRLGHVGCSSGKKTVPEAPGFVR
jgi:hypothetical protein